MSGLRLYLIQPLGTKYPERYYPGVLSDGTQVLMRRGGLYKSYGLWFTPDGWLREFRFRYHDPTEPADPVETRDKRSAEMVFAWQEDIGCRPGTIRVRQFSISRPVRVSISDYTSAMLDWVDAIDELGPDELAEGTEGWYQREYLKCWRERGDFVLYWEGAGFILNGEGHPAS